MNKLTLLFILALLSLTASAQHDFIAWTELQKADGTFAEPVYRSFQNGYFRFNNPSDDIDAIREHILQNYVYPRRAFEENVQGGGVVEFIIEKDGTVQQAWSPQGNEELQAEVLRIIKAMRFHPATRDGKPVRAYMQHGMLIRKDTSAVVAKDYTINANTPIDREVLPAFSSGATAQSDFTQFFNKNVKYPEQAAQLGIPDGFVVIEFIVETDGSLTNFRLVKSHEPSCADEAMRVAKMMPKWQPGGEIKDGNFQPRRSRVTINVWMAKPGPPGSIL